MELEFEKLNFASHEPHYYLLKEMAKSANRGIFLT